jgi:hypothetical protein
MHVALLLTTFLVTTFLLPTEPDNKKSNLTEVLNYHRLHTIYAVAGPNDLYSHLMSNLHCVQCNT